MKTEYLLLGLGVVALFMLGSAKPTEQASLEDRVAWALKNETDQTKLAELAAECLQAGRADLALEIGKRRGDLANQGK